LLISEVCLGIEDHVYASANHADDEEPNHEVVLGHVRSAFSFGLLARSAKHRYNIRVSLLNLKGDSAITYLSGLCLGLLAFKNY